MENGKIHERTDDYGATLIIGNGFDQKCGLASNFSQYFESRASSDNDLRTYKNACTPGTGSSHSSSDLRKLGSRINYWMLVFFAISACLAKPVWVFRWCDVEQAVHDVLTRNGIYAHWNFENLELAHVNESWKYYCDFDAYWAMVGRIDFLKDSKRTLLDELKDFEKDFSDYLGEQVKANRNSYWVSVASLLTRLYSMAGIDRFDGDAKRYLLSYNYIPYSDYRKELRGAGIALEEAKNVHGSIDRNVLIGITPAKGEEKDSNLLKYAKEYRRFDLAMHDQDKVTKPVLAKNVIFFGLSFSQQDHESVFRIFDETIGGRANVDHWHKFYFAYSNWQQLPPEEAEAQQFQIVKDLLLAWQEDRNLNWRGILDDLVDKHCIEIKCIG